MEAENKRQITDNLEWHHGKKKSLRTRIQNVIIMTLSCMLYAFAVSTFLDPNSLAPGGATGVAIILSRFLKLEVGTLIWVINIPIMLLGMWKFGVRFILSTLYCITCISAFANIFAPIGGLTTDPLVASIAGSCASAVAIGLIFKAGATTGGTDIVVRVLRQKFPHMKSGAIFMSVDLAIVAVSALAFQNIESAAYAGLTVFLTSTLLDMVLYGKDEAKLIYIISDKTEAITERLLRELDLGVTHIQATGAYSGKEKKVIFCVTRKQLAPQLEGIVRDEDPQSFMIVTKATEIYGEGYKNIFSERL